MTDKEFQDAQQERATRYAQAVGTAKARLFSLESSLRNFTELFVSFVEDDHGKKVIGEYMRDWQREAKDALTKIEGLTEIRGHE